VDLAAGSAWIARVFPAVRRAEATRSDAEIRLESGQLATQVV